MNKVSKRLLSGVMLSLCMGAFPNEWTENESFGPDIQNIADAGSPFLVTIDPYLLSFGDASFSFGNGYISFSGWQRVYRLFDIPYCERPQVLDYKVCFDFSYLSRIDLGRMEVSLIDPYAVDPIMTESIYVYPFEDDHGIRDAEFFMNDISFIGSEYVKYGYIEPCLNHEIGKLSVHSAVSQAVMLEKDAQRQYLIECNGDAVLNPSVYGFDFIQTATNTTTPETSGIIYPIIQIASILISLDSSVGMAAKLFPRPDPVEGLATLALFLFKNRLAFANFDSNKNLAIPRYSPYEDLYINSQNMRIGEKYDNDYTEPSDEYAWAKWKFGLSDMHSSGCPVFSVFNMLIDSSYYLPHLPSLIALFELSNADLLFGRAGVLPIDSNMLSMLSYYLSGAFAWIIWDIARSLSVIPTVGLSGFLFGTWIISYFVNVVVSAMVNVQGDMGDILSLFDLTYSTENFLVDGNYLFEDFRGDLEYRRQGIVCYWNDVDANTNMPDVSGNAHFVYVRNDVLLDGKYYVYNRDCVGSDPLSFFETDITALIDAENVTTANLKMIAFYVLQ